MYSIFSMFFTALLSQLRQVKRNLMLLIVPVFVFCAMYFFFSFNQVEESYMKPLSIGIVVGEDSAYAGILGDSFTSYDAFTNFVSIQLGSYEEIYKAFYEGQYDAVLEVPEGFVDAVMSFSYNPVKATINYEDPFKAALIKDFLVGYESYITSAEVGIVTLTDQMRLNGYDYGEVRAYNEVIAYDLIFTALNRHELFEYKEVVDIPSVGSLSYFLVAIMVMFLMYIALFAGTVLMREKKEHCLSRIKVTGTSMTLYIGAKVMATTVFIFMMAGIWLLLYSFVSEISLAKNMQGLLSLLFLAIFFDVSLAVMISAFFERDESVVLFSSVFIFVNALIGGSIIPIHIMPKSVLALGRFSPNFWMIRGFLYFISGKNMAEGQTIMLILGFISVVMIIVAGMRYRKVV